MFQDIESNDGVELPVQADACDVADIFDPSTRIGIQISTGIFRGWEFVRQACIPATHVENRRRIKRAQDFSCKLNSRHGLKNPRAGEIADAVG